MLPYNKRIRRAEFQYILSRGKRYNSPHLLLYIAPKDSVIKKSTSSFAFSVSKKVAKLAVDRNRLRRRGYSIISKYYSRITPGYLLLFSFKKDSKTLHFAVLEKEIAGLLKDSSVLI